MKFFKKIRQYYKAKKILPLAGFLMLAAGIVVFGVFLLRDKSITRISLRGIEDIGIPLPTPVLGVIFIIGGIIMVVIFIKNAHNDWDEREYNSLLKAVKKLGDMDSIGNKLAAIPKSKYTSHCEMRINDNFLFFRDSTQATVFDVKNIISAEMDTAARPKNRTAFFVRVKYKESNNGEFSFGVFKRSDNSIIINSTKKKFVLLCNEIKDHMMSEENNQNCIGEQNYEPLLEKAEAIQKDHSSLEGSSIKEEKEQAFSLRLNVPENLNKIEYALKFKTDDGMIRYVKTCVSEFEGQDKEVIENILKLPDAEVRKKLNQILLNSR